MACSKKGDYGQNGQKQPIVRKMCFAYGQISQKWHFVRNLSEILDRLAEQYCCLKKIVFIHWKLKKPDKGSRNSTAFVRLFV